MKRRLLFIAAFVICGLQAGAQTILGIDVSSYQTTINWTQVKNPGDKIFAIAKATEGLTITDAYFVTNETNGAAAGVVMGAYHFAHPETNSATSEANYFLSVASPYIGAGHIPPALDLEDPPTGLALTSAFTSAQLTTWVQTWMTTVQNATGVKPILYTDGSIANYLNASLNTYGLWTADPDGSPTVTPSGTYLGVWGADVIKQYSWTGTVSGISGTGDEDLDVFNGTQAQFNTFIGLVVNPKFTADVTTVCQGSQVHFTDQSTSTGTITEYKWTFTGGTPDTSTSKNPVVTYNTAGSFTVKEVVISTAGTDSVIETAYIHVIPTSTLPLVQTFQSSTFPPTGWTMNYPNPGDSAWELCTSTGYSSSQCMYFPANCGYVTSIAGERQQIYTPDYSFVGTTNPKMWFDVAYEPYNEVYSDTLAVYYSLDCGTTWTLVYLKGGMTLSTTGSTDSAGVDTSGGRGCFVPPNSAAWRTDTINLASISGQSSVMFSIESRSGWGNIIYLDNINVASTGACTPPVASITAGGPTTFCQGGSVTLTAASASTYLWSNGATTQSIHATQSGNYTVVAGNGSCSTTSTATVVTVNPLPVVSAGASVSQQCINLPVTLTATGNGTSYQWSGAGLQTSTGTSVNATVATAGTQTYQVTATLNGCTASASATVTFGLTVAPTATITQTTSNPICAGSPVSFSVTSGNGGANPVYQWSTSNSQSGTGSSFTINSAADGETVKCLLISTANCASPDSVYSNILTVTTQSPQPVSISVTTPDTNVCSGENIAFTSTETNGGNNPVYNWYVNGSSAGSASTYTLNNIQSTSSVYCVITSSSGCVTGSPATSNTITVRIQNSVAASLGISANSNPVCAGVPVTFTATPGNGGSTPVYAWAINGNVVGANSATYISAGLHTGDVVTCSMTSSASCVTNPNVSSNTITMQVNPLPVANAGTSLFVSSTSSVVLGGSPSASGGTSPYSYNWSPPTGLNSTASSNPVESGIGASTLYTLTVTDAYGCTASDTVGVYLINCNLATPVVQLNLCDLAAQNIPAVNYQWYLQSNAISGATSRFYSASQSGYYYVKVNDTVGCTAQSADVFVNYPACLNTGIAAVSGNPDFEVYPNPATSEITVSLVNPMAGTVHVEMVDLLGQTVYRGGDIDASSGFKYNINTISLTPGAYLVKVVTGEGKFGVKRIVKM